MEELLERLREKQQEYAEDDGDCLAQFRRAGELQGCSPESALLGMAVKHVVALFDLVRKGEKAKNVVNSEKWEEYIGDIVVYMLILNEMVIDTFPREVKEKSDLVMVKERQATQGMVKKGKR